MEKKNYIFVTDINYLIRLLQEDIDRYSRLLNAVALLGKFDKKIKLTVNHDYKDTNLVYAVDKDNKVFAFYDNCERDMKKRYTLYVRDRDIVKRRYLHPLPRHSRDAGLQFRNRGKSACNGGRAVSMDQGQSRPFRLLRPVHRRLRLYLCPLSFTTTSTWTWIDHPVSGLRILTLRPVKTWYPFGSAP